MGRRKNDTAGGAVARDEIADHVPAAPIERGQRLVEQPKRSRRDNQTAECNSPLLPGGKISRRHVAKFVKAALDERFLNASASPKVALVKFEVLGWSHLRLYGVLVSDPGNDRTPLFSGCKCVAIVQSDNDASGGRLKKTRDRPEERRFAGSVAAGYCGAAARGNPEVQTTLHDALATHERNVLDLQFGKRPHCVNTYAVHR